MVAPRLRPSKLQGAILSRRPWFDLGKQQLQPLFQRLIKLKVHVDAPATGTVALQLSWVEAVVEYGPAYSGGSVLRIQGVPFFSLLKRSFTFLQL